MPLRVTADSRPVCVSLATKVQRSADIAPRNTRKRQVTRQQGRRVQLYGARVSGEQLAADGGYISRMGGYAASKLTHSER